MDVIPNRTKVSSAESIARKADRGENLSRFFTNNRQMMRPINHTKEKMVDQQKGSKTGKNS
jgi:hypothetical protein